VDYNPEDRREKSEESGVTGGVATLKKRGQVKRLFERKPTIVRVKKLRKGNKRKRTKSRGIISKMGRSRGRDMLENKGIVPGKKKTSRVKHSTGGKKGKRRKNTKWPKRGMLQRGKMEGDERKRTLEEEGGKRKEGGKEREKKKGLVGLLSRRGYKRRKKND